MRPVARGDMAGVHAAVVERRHPEPRGRPMVGAGIPRGRGARRRHRRRLCRGAVRDPVDPGDLARRAAGRGGPPGSPSGRERADV